MEKYVDLIPSVEDMDAIAAKRGEKLGVIRSLTAFSVDWIVCVVINLAVNYIPTHYMTDGEKGNVIFKGS